MRKILKKIKREAEIVSETLSTFRIFNLKILTLLLLLVLNATGHNFIKTPPNNKQLDELANLKKEKFVNEIKTNAKINLITEVDNFIDSLAPTNKLSAENIINICNDYDIELIFVLAQGLLESHYGTRGVASRTNSIFNVGTYDDGQILYRYKHPDDSIEPYAKLLVKRYLVNRTENHLLQDKGYTNVYGQRFASSKRYESSMRALMSKIDIETSIGMLQEIINMDDKSIIAFFGPDKLLDDHGHDYYALK